MQKIAVARTVATKIAVVKPTRKISLNTAETMTNENEKRIPAPTKRALDVVDDKPSDTDVNGSYTGRPKNKRELPVQDADDL